MNKLQSLIEMVKKEKNGTFIHGIGASQHLDSSGERIIIEGIDISRLTEDGTFNYEHKSDNSSSIVGKILGAKKILKRADCDTDAQRYFWDNLKMPYLYVWGELFDAVGHSGAKDVAAMLRYDETNKAKEIKKLVNFSIEGARLDKDGSDILKCIARKISITITPCNKTCEAEQFDPKDLKKIGSVTSDGELFTSIENLVNKSEEHFPSCQLIKMDRMPTPTLPSERRAGTAVKPKNTFTPKNAPSKMRVGDRIDYTKQPRAKTGRELYGKKEKMISTPAKEMVGEHESLVDVLESPSHKDDKKEAKKQKKELKEYKEKMKKGFVPNNANNLAPGIAKGHIGEEVQSRIRRRQRPKQMASKPRTRRRPAKMRVKPKQNRLARLGMYDSNMRKAIAAGGMGGAPSAAVQGGALQKGERGDWEKENYKLTHSFHFDNPNTDGDHIKINAIDPKGKIVGGTKLYIYPNQLYPDAIEIHPKHRRKGLASAMYNHAENLMFHRTGQIHNIIPSESQTSYAEKLWTQKKRPFGKSEALRFVSDQAFENFNKKQELIDFLANRLPGLNKQEILALAKTVAYTYTKRKEIQLENLMKGDVVSIKTGQKVNPKPKKTVFNVDRHLNKLKDLHSKLKDLHNELDQHLNPKTKK